MEPDRQRRCAGGTNVFRILRDGASTRGVKRRVGWALGGRVDDRCATPGAGGTNASTSGNLTLSCHKGGIAQSGFHGSIKPSLGMHATASAAESMLAVRFTKTYCNSSHQIPSTIAAGNEPTTMFNILVSCACNDIETMAIHCNQKIL
ncbi:hypothetical protein B0H19DRAFT_1055675 [Mycena capillaripes]|nr:hypothetical protein B0H19DRAFT_1055675 [Mycena capillaripes]